MATKLDKPIIRWTDTTINKRKLIVGLEPDENNEPFVTLRLKGLRSSKRMSLKKLAEIYFKESK